MIFYVETLRNDFSFLPAYVIFLTEAFYPPDKSMIALKNNVIEKKKEKFLHDSETVRIEAHAGFFRLLMKGIFDPYVL